MPVHQTPDPKRRKKTALFSPNSVSKTSASKETRVTTKSTFSIDSNGELMFHFTFNSGQRDDTVLGKSQGDHVTPFVAILEAMINSMNDNDLYEAGDRIRKFASLILNDELDPTENSDTSSKERFLLIKPIIKTYEKGLRDIIKESRDNEKIDTTRRKAYTQANIHMKIGKSTIIAQYIQTLITEFLTEVQKDPLTTFYSKNRTNKKDAEGSTIKTAARVFFMIDKLCQITNCEDDQQFEELYKSFTKGLESRKSGEKEGMHSIKYGLTAFFDKNKSNKLLEELNNTSNNTEKKEILQNLKNEIFSNTKKMAQFMEDFIDYHRIITFKKEFKDEINSEYHINPSYKIKNHETHISVKRKNYGELKKIMDRFSLIISTAFENIFNDEKLDKEDLFYKFIDIFLKNQGWSDFEVKPNKIIKHKLTQDIKESFNRTSNPSDKLESISDLIEEKYGEVNQILDLDPESEAEVESEENESQNITTEEEIREKLEKKIREKLEKEIREKLEKEIREKLEKEMQQRVEEERKKIKEQLENEHYKKRRKSFVNKTDNHNNQGFFSAEEQQSGSDSPNSSPENPEAETDKSNTKNSPQIGT